MIRGISSLSSRSDFKFQITSDWPRRHEDWVKVTPADSFVAPETNAGFDTYASVILPTGRALKRYTGRIVVTHCRS
jgi:hypothetical protein